MHPLLVHNNVAEAVGGTPLVELHNIRPRGGARILAKLESRNPGGSVKDRIGRAMIEDAERRGLVTAGSTIVEPTSGNTGIALAVICAARGYKCILTMPQGMSPERVQVLKAFGAEVIQTSEQGGMAEAILEAEDIVRQLGNRAYMPQQFENPANPDIHRRTTAPEILAEVPANQIGAFVAGVGTGGTITGVGEVLKAANSAIQIVALEPEMSAVLSGKKPGLHGIQGIGAGFIPAVLNTQIINQIITMTDRRAFEMKDTLSRDEGLLVGISAGANVAGAVEIARETDPNLAVITVLCDTGERYLSVHRRHSLRR